MSSIEFTLFAPTIAEAKLLGSFPEWKDISMSFEQGTFRCSVEISDGDHEYKFRIRRHNEDNWIDIIDPYLIIYEMYVADFAENGKYSGFIDKLDYLCELGINAIEILPIQGTFYLRKMMDFEDICLGLESMGFDHDWGYSTRHFCALKKNYGTSVELKQLVDECHRRQIRIIIDAVFNHTAED